MASLRRAREQDDLVTRDAPGNSGSGETNGAMANGADSDNPAHGSTNGVNSESNIDVSVLTEALPLPPING